MNKWLTIAQNKKDSKTVDVTIRGLIVDDKWYDNEFSPRDLDAIMKIEADYINVYLNSPGGNVFAGVEIYSMLKRHPAAVTVIVEGIAASIATTILAAGDQKAIVKNGMFYLHKPLTGAYGYASDLRKIADELDVCEESIINAYDYNKMLDRDQIQELMANETLMTAQDALAKGFIDYIVDEEADIDASENGEYIVVNGVKVTKQQVKNLKFEKIQGKKPAKTDKNKGKKQVKTAENKDKIVTNHENTMKKVYTIAKNQLHINKMEVF